MRSPPEAMPRVVNAPPPWLGRIHYPKIRKTVRMWKIIIGFAVFAALALFILVKSGGNVDLGGEKHEVAPATAPAPAAAASK
jgi:hypothetical protein